MRVASLGSGSRGNATLVQGGGSSLLVDCGLTLRELKRRAMQLQFDLATLDAILLTHEHSDHCSGVGALARHYGIPVYLTHGTRASGRIDSGLQLCEFDSGAVLDFRGLRVNSVTVPHDAREPVQYCFEDGQWRLGVLTDLGSVTRHVCEAYSGCDLLVLEFNHDRRMLAEGPYPASLKRRVGGPWGHLSNEQAVELLAELDLDRLRAVVAAHISEKNNSRAAVTELLRRALPAVLPKMVWASQDEGFGWISLTGSRDSRAAGSVPVSSLERCGARSAY